MIGQVIVQYQRLILFTHTVTNHFRYDLIDLLIDCQRLFCTKYSCHQQNTENDAYNMHTAFFSFHDHPPQ